MNGFRQGIVSACLLFNVALEKVIQDSGIQTKGTIFYKLIQLLAYDDNLDMISRIIVVLKEAFLPLVETAEENGPKGGSFVYLGTMVNSDGGHLYFPTNALNCIKLIRLKSTCIDILKDN